MLTICAPVICLYDIDMLLPNERLLLPASMGSTLPDMGFYLVTSLPVEMKIYAKKSNKMINKN